MVYEQSFTDADWRWPEDSWGQPLPILPHDPKTKHDIRSATKSVVALLVGVAVDCGLLKSRDTAALDFFPRIRRSALARAGPYLNFWRQIETAPNPYRLILERPMTAMPATEFRYNVGSTELIAELRPAMTPPSLHNKSLAWSANR